MRNKFALAILLLALSACASIPEEESASAPAEQPSETLLSRQVVAAHEQSVRLELRLSDFEKKLGTLGQLVRKLAKQQNGLEERIEHLHRAGTATGKAPSPPRVRRAPRPCAQQKTPSLPRIEKSQSAAKPRKLLPVDSTLAAQESYNIAYRSIRARKSEEAILHFRDFLRRFPKNKLAANAQYWLGESYYDLREYPAALEEFKKVLTRYPNSRKAPDAYYKRALTYLRIKNPRLAALEFEKLIEGFPKDRLTEKAKSRLRTLHQAGISTKP